MGEVFDGDDSLSVWICILAVAFNDQIHANVKVDEAQSDWERAYEWRVAISHFNEACLHLDRGRTDDRLVAFLETDPQLRTRFDEVLSGYEAVKRLANRIRNEAAFHYPYKRGQKAVARALRELSDDEGTMRGAKLRDSRQEYADEVVARLIMNASGGSDESMKEAAQAFGQAVAAFGRFAHLALESYFLQRAQALRREG
jgi:hypothetical protein